MKNIISFLLSLFFIIAIGVHIYYVINKDQHSIWWHCLYYLTYGICWWMLFSKKKYNAMIYLLFAIFPFITHLYYAYKHFTSLDAMFWICILVCTILPLGYYWILFKDKSNLQSEDV